MRNSLLDIVSYLANEPYQQELWVRESHPYRQNEDFFHSIDEISHFIFDDMMLDKDIFAAVGTLLETEQEAVAIRELVAALDACISVLNDASDREYIQSPGWIRVIETARIARETMVIQIE